MPAARGAVEVFAVDLARSHEEVKKLAVLLDGVELRRAANMRIEAGRRRFIVARASLRLLLGLELAADPAELEFVHGPNGKPAPATGTLAFNVAHSGELALLAVSHGGEVGVDIEQIRSRRDPMRIAQRYFTPDECAAIEAAGSARLVTFYRHWVAKEAYVKAIGSGIAGSLRAFGVELEPLPRVLDPGRSENWTLEPLEVGAGYAAALVSEGAPESAAEVRAFDPLAEG